MCVHVMRLKVLLLNGFQRRYWEPVYHDDQNQPILHCIQCTSMFYRDQTQSDIEGRQHSINVFHPTDRAIDSHMFALNDITNKLDTILRLNDVISI